MVGQVLYIHYNDFERGSLFFLASSKLETTSSDIIYSK